MHVSRSLTTAPCEGNVLCRERKTSSVSSSGVLGVSAGALQCHFAHSPAGVPWLGLQELLMLLPHLHSSCCRGGYREHILCAYLCQRKKSSWEQSPKLGRTVWWPSFWTGRCNMEQREKGNSAFCIFSVLELPLHSLCRRGWRSHVLMNTNPVLGGERSSLP